MPGIDEGEEVSTNSINGVDHVRAELINTSQRNHVDHIHREGDETACQSDRRERASRPSDRDIVRGLFLCFGRGRFVESVQSSVRSFPGRPAFPIDRETNIRADDDHESSKGSERDRLRYAALRKYPQQSTRLSFSREVPRGSMGSLCSCRSAISLRRFDCDKKIRKYVFDDSSPARCSFNAPSFM